MSWKRARSSEQKAKRASAILSAAGELFDERELSDISMRDIAQKSNLGKASLYSYFKTKEEVFASLFLVESEHWFLALEKKLKRLRSPNANRVSKVLTDILREQERFCRLTVVLASVLERNLSKEFIHSFKSELQNYLKKYVGALIAVKPEMTMATGMQFLYQHQSIVAGLWPLTHPSPEVAKVLQNEEFQGMQVDFYKLFQQTMEKLLSD